MITTVLVSDGELQIKYISFLLATTPMLLVSLSEDLNVPTKALYRLVAVAISNIAVIILLNEWLPRIGIPQVTPIMHTPIGAIITIVVISGITNSFNLIDGLNGLCAGFSLCAFIAVNVIAVKTGLDGISHIATMYATIIIAFMIFNFPFAKIYLGDTGSYFFGFIYSWLGVMSLVNVHEIVAPTYLLICAYPVSEMLFSIARRYISGKAIFKPDQLHLHHLIHDFAKISFPQMRAGWHNPLASIAISPLYIAPMIYAVNNFESRQSIFLGFAAFFALYTAIYIAINLANRSKR
jgi:UDP-N-acetylmuramyl pentapeptide phosphotransferase/UDP-N-acetylglucosamine-1-phosphate transferase